jgi:SAM-dependent methyltransferase
MRNYGLADWHMLALRPRTDVALDVGCGFGSLSLGLSAYFAKAMGVDALRSRVRFAGLRASQDQRHADFLVGNALDLPVRSGSVDLVTVNGVLEWAGLFAEGNPRALQIRLLEEARRALRKGGTAAVAIENRFAMETLVGMPDTHTGLRFAPALPRGVAGALSRATRGEPFRTYLYDAGGYLSLGRRAGFPEVRIFDLVSSYNDYDFILDVRDAASYRLLWKRLAVRSFYPRARTVRSALSRIWAGALGKVSYAYLLLMGDRVVTLMDKEHPQWQTGSGRAHVPGPFRFAVKGTLTPSIAIVSHDGDTLRSVIEVGLGLEESGRGFACLPPAIADALGARAALAECWSANGVDFRAHSMKS